MQELLRPRHTAAVPPSLSSAPSAPGPRPVPRFKPGGAASHGRLPMHPAASCATRRALHAAARRGRTRREQEQRTARGLFTQAAGPHPQSTPRARPRALEHSTAARTRTRTCTGHGTRRTTQGGRAGGLGGWALRAVRRHPQRAVPFSIDVRARGTQGGGGRRGSAAAQRAKARRMMQGRQVGRWRGGGRALGRCGAVASQLVRFVQLADLAPYTQAS